MRGPGNKVSNYRFLGRVKMSRVVDFGGERDLPLHSLLMPKTPAPRKEKTRRNICPTHRSAGRLRVEVTLYLPKDTRLHRQWPVPEEGNAVLLFQELWKQGQKSRILPCTALHCLQLHPGCQQLLAAGT